MCDLESPPTVAADIATSPLLECQKTIEILVFEGERRVGMWALGRDQMIAVTHMKNMCVSYGKHGKLDWRFEHEPEQGS